MGNRHQHRGRCFRLSVCFLAAFVSLAANAQPAAPDDLWAASGDEEAILTPSNSNIVRYELRSGAGEAPEFNAWAAVPGSHANASEHTVSGLANGTHHVLKLRAVDDDSGAASGLHAAGLFLPVGAADTADTAADSPSVAKSAQKRQSKRPSMSVSEAWERRVRIARDELARARAGVESAGAGRLLLNVREGLRLNVVVERTAPSGWGYSLSGRVVGGSRGFVTLVVHDEAVAGSIWTPNAEYELSYLGGGVHALWDMTDAPPMLCGGTSMSSDSFGAEMTVQGGTDDGSVVDILVVWTPQAEEEYGGIPVVLSLIDMLIAYANDSFERSGAFVSLRLVGAEKVDYAETGGVTDIRRLAEPDDGHMDRVHDRRDALGADLIYLLTSRRGLGLAFGPFSTGGYAGGVVFAHEVGHSMGLLHDRRADGNGGFQNGFTTEHCFATIMSYGASCNRYNGPKLPFYASPWRYDPSHGVPLGVTRFAWEQGAEGPADAVLALNRNRRRTANYRPSRDGQEQVTMELNRLFVTTTGTFAQATASEERGLLCSTAVKRNPKRQLTFPIRSCVRRWKSISQRRPAIR